MRFIISKLSEKAVRALASALDPIISSATIFLIQGAVLISANKIEFGTFSLSYSYVIMGQSVMSSLFGSPLLTLLSNMQSSEDSDLTAIAILRLQIFAALAAGGLGFIIAVLFKVSWLVALIGVFGFVGLSFRDALRNVLVVQYRLNEALLIAMTFALMSAICLAIFYVIFGRITAVGGLSVLAVGASLTLSRQMFASLLSRESLSRRVMLDMGGMVSWSLPGTIVIWLQNSFYLTLVAINFNLSAVAEVSAARMTIMPILVATSGLLRFLQVQISKMMTVGDLPKAVANSQRIAVVAGLVGFSLAATLFFLNFIVPHRLLPHQYPHVLQLSASWMVFAAANTARGAYTSLFQAMGRYRELFVSNVVIAPLVIVGITVMPTFMGLIGAVLPMAIGEVFLIIALAWRISSVVAIDCADLAPGC